VIHVLGLKTTIGTDENINIGLQPEYEISVGILCRLVNATDLRKRNIDYIFYPVKL